MGAVACLAGVWAARRTRAELPSNWFPEAAAGGWRRITLRDPPWNAWRRCPAVGPAGPMLCGRRRPSADTVFFYRGRLFVIVKWQSADRELLRESVTELEKRLADANRGRK
jgi:hypothetical protein